MSALAFVQALLETGRVRVPPDRDAPADANAVVHATRGVVKALNATTLVVSRRRKRGDITFTLGRGVHVEGIIELGATVSVRYRDEGSDHVRPVLLLDPRVHLSEPRVHVGGAVVRQAGQQPPGRIAGLSI